MKLTPAIAIARKAAGYRPPAEDEVCCATCGAVQHKRSYRHRCYYYCRRHMFYVHSRGVCPKFDTAPFVEPEQKKPLFVQEEMGL